MIDVLLPLYNPSKFLNKTIESVLNQSFKNLNLIIINDSETSLHYLIEDFNDERLLLYNLGRNYGIAHALWYGNTISKSKYIARIDDGDYWHYDKILKQVDFLENNPEYILCGTQANLISDLKTSKTNFPINNEQIKHKIYYSRSCLIHTSIVFKNVNILYDKNIFGSEDMFLYKQLINFGKFHIINELLVDVKITKHGITGSNWHAIMLSHIFMQLGIKPIINNFTIILIKFSFFLNFLLYKSSILNRNIFLNKYLAIFLSPLYLLWQLSKIFKGRKIV
jgi:glycosyltransferase involved in cell wall biosynthesis